MIVYRQNDDFAAGMFMKYPVDRAPFNRRQDTVHEEIAGRAFSSTKDGRVFILGIRNFFQVKLFHGSSPWKKDIILGEYHISFQKSIGKLPKI
ncbi:MAG: hypothetical protein JXR73_06785 [Candidatus Omnitrophica bacterium]|nr:hypothetical protein [Candidatus Omnitrophota bacterium]